MGLLLVNLAGRLLLELQLVIVAYRVKVLRDNITDGIVDRDVMGAPVLLLALVVVRRLLVPTVIH